MIQVFWVSYLDPNMPMLGGHWGGGCIGSCRARYYLLPRTLEATLQLQGVE